MGFPVPEILQCRPPAATKISRLDLLPADAGEGILPPVGGGSGVWTESVAEYLQTYFEKRTSLICVGRSAWIERYIEILTNLRVTFMIYSMYRYVDVCFILIHMYIPYYPDHDFLWLRRIHGRKGHTWFRSTKWPSLGSSGHGFTRPSSMSRHMVLLNLGMSQPFLFPRRQPHFSTLESLSIIYIYMPPVETPATVVILFIWMAR